MCRLTITPISGDNKKKSNIDYKILYPISLLYKKEFDKDSVSGIDKSVNHRKFKQSQNTWEKAAKTIHETIK